MEGGFVPMVRPVVSRPVPASQAVAPIKVVKKTGKKVKPVDAEASTYAKATVDKMAGKEEVEEVKPTATIKEEVKADDIPF